MPDKQPTPKEAQLSLAEATRRGADVSRAANRSRLLLLIIAAMVLAVGVITGIRPQQLDPPRAIALVVVVLAGLIGIGILSGSLRAYGRWGLARLALIIAIFLVWAGAVFGVGSAVGWLGHDQPGFHTTVATAVAALPLLLAAFLGKKAV